MSHFQKLVQHTQSMSDAELKRFIQELDAVVIQTSTMKQAWKAELAAWREELKP